MLIVTGPAGSGKTTTIHALLRHLLLTRPELSVVSLEDPVERLIPGVAQVEVSSFGELTYERALRSILRQDPQVLALGEVRDAATASLAVQAALSGHRLLCTMHAGTAFGAIARLLEMGGEPFQISGTVFGILGQRLLRRRVDSGYAGRIPIATWTRMSAGVRQAVLRRDFDELRSACLAASEPTMEQEAAELVQRGLTDAAEVARVLGSG
jgi:type II secretory ATPase GspE/PulE/Tfp pilus assembly ATPase PilB-like protein